MSSRRGDLVAISRRPPASRRVLLIRSISARDQTTRGKPASAEAPSARRNGPLPRKRGRLSHDFFARIYLFRRVSGRFGRSVHHAPRSGPAASVRVLHGREVLAADLGGAARPGFRRRGLSAAASEWSDA
jgi:hypothetical protein